MRLYKSMTLILCIAVLVFSVSGCCQSSRNNIEDTHILASDEPTSLPWEEAFGFFYTLDVTRAQKEIPFTIVLPTYIPDKREITLLPNIKGPLSAFQNNNQVTIEILYNVDYGEDNSSTVYIHEMNFPLLPADPELNPGYYYVEISGESVIWTEGGVLGDSVIYLYFNHENIYYEVRLDALPYEEAVKVVESMINQLK